MQNRKIELNDGSSSTKGRCNLTASTHATLQSCNGTPGRIKVDALIEAEGIVLLSFDTCFHAGKSSWKSHCSRAEREKLASMTLSLIACTLFCEAHCVKKEFVTQLWLLPPPLEPLRIFISFICISFKIFVTSVYIFYCRIFVRWWFMKNKCSYVEYDEF